jgi:hypothetical protein
MDIGVLIGTQNPLFLFGTIPVTVFYFSLLLLLLTYHTRIQEGGMCDWELQANGLPEARDYAKYHRFVAAFLRFCDWFEPKTPREPDHDT